VYDRVAEAQPRRDEQRAEQQRERDVGARGGQRAAHGPGQRLAAGAAENGERGPVVGQGGVAEADARGGEDERGG
jgi:hypothetical protein